MAREIKDIQKLIEERAILRLTSDIKNLEKLITSQPLLKHNGRNEKPPVGELVGKLPDGEPIYEKTNVTALFSVNIYTHLHDSTNYMGQLYRYWLPIYIEQESREFLEKLDQIQDDVNDLLNNQPQQ